MYYAYFDDSGAREDQLAFSLGGLISTSKRWETFQQDWESALDEFRHDTQALDFFHMTDFVARRGVYKDWSDEHRQERLAKLHRIIVENCIACIGVTIPMHVFRGLYPAAVKSRPFEILARELWTQLAICLDESYPSLLREKVAYTFEAGTSGLGEVAKAFNEALANPTLSNRYRLFSMDSAPKSLSPLQGADLAAYEGYKDWKMSLGGQHDPNWSKLPRLRSIIPNYWKWVNARALGQYDATWINTRS